MAALDAERAHERELRPRARMSVGSVADNGHEFSVVPFLVPFVITPPIGLGYAVYGGWHAFDRRR